MRCWFQDIFCNTPPQEQGTYSLNLVIAMIYAVNITIKLNEAYNPINRDFGNANIIDIIISREGITQDTQPANAVNKGD